MTLRRLEVRLLINTRQRGARGGERRRGRWLGARIEVGRKGVEEEKKRGKKRKWKVEGEKCS